jgi:hypothetical protein
MKLTIELIPKTSFYNNLRSIVTGAEWEFIRQGTIKNANNICEVCGGKSINRGLDCHEVWSFNDISHVQKLEKVIALCEKCHEVKHIGLAQVKGNFSRARKHFKEINNLSELATEDLIVEAFTTWETRSKHKWQLDITILKVGE